MFGKALERLAALERAMKKLGDAQRDQATTLQARFGELEQKSAHQPTAKDVRGVLDAVRALERRFDEAEDRRLQAGGTVGMRLLDEKRLRKRLDAIAAGTAPIVVGPWTGEVGFELLYWVPFVRWVREQWRLAPERLVVVSRGGVESWYDVPRSQYVDAFSLVSPAEFQAGVAQERLKQRRAGTFDQQLATAAAARLGLGDVELLHPSLMYRMFMPFWRDELGAARVDRFARFAKLPAPDEAMPPQLPADYVAARFYFSDAFPDTPANRAFAHDTIAALAGHTAVVVLNPQVDVDDHVDWAPAAGNGIFTIAGGLTPERNLARQTRVISGARAFVGTYGGYAYLAPFHGVPALAFYSAPTFKRHHLQLAQRVFEQLGGATVNALDVAHAPLLQQALSAAAGARS